MSRWIFAFLFVFAIIFTAAYMLMEQASGPGTSAKPAPGTELAKNDEVPIKNEESKSAIPTSASNSDQGKSDLSPKVQEEKKVVENVSEEPRSPEPSIRPPGQKKQKTKRTITRSFVNTPAPKPKARETNGGIWDEDLDRLHGIWRMVDVEYDGERNSGESKNYSWDFRVDEYTINYKGNFEELWVVEVNSSRQPKTIDGTGKATKIAPITSGKKLMGIYEVTDDTLKVCYDLTGNGRPDSFKAAKGSRRACYYFER